jgi:hypothetical protein
MDFDRLKFVNCVKVIPFRLEVLEQKKCGGFTKYVATFHRVLAVIDFQNHAIQVQDFFTRITRRIYEVVSCSDSQE